MQILGNKKFIYPNSIIRGTGNGSDSIAPKILWTFWDSPIQSPLVEACLKKVKKIAPDYDLKVVNLQNLSFYLPDIVPQNKDLPFINYIDLIRLELLKKFGGLYFDAATLFLTHPKWIFEFHHKNRNNLTGFYSELCTNNYEKPILESWMMVSAPNDNFITKWCESFRNCYISKNPYDYYKDIKNNPEELQNIGGLSDYLIIYLAAISAMQDQNEYKVGMFSANQTGHYFYFGSGLSHHEIANLILRKSTPNQIPLFIKFINTTRNLIDQQIKHGRYKKNAIIFSILDLDITIQEFLKRRFNFFKFIFIRILKRIINNCKF